MTLHNIVNNDVFLLVTGISSIVSLLIGLWAIKNIYQIKQEKTNTINPGTNSTSIIVEGDGGQGAGRDIKNG